MAVREFTDSEGRAWTAWNVTPESMHPQTKAEDYLVDCFQLGWLAFESSAGHEKRRLCPYPRRWDECSEQELQSLLAHAEVVLPLRLGGDRQVAAARADDRAPGAAPHLPPPAVVRSFWYPEGRFWTAALLIHPDDGGQPRLRFSSGTRVIDLPSWPRDWAARTDEQLVALLRAAAPRLNVQETTPDTPVRRWDDSRR